MTAIRLRTFIPKPFLSEADQAIGPLVWGLWVSPMFQSFLGLFVRAPDTKPPLGLMPLWAWSTVAVVIALYRYWAAHLLALNHRAYAASLCAVFWGILAASYFVSQPVSEIAPLCLVLAVLSIFSMIRILVLR